MLKSLFGGKSSALPSSQLPQLHAFIDVLVAGRPSRLVSVDAISSKGIVTKECLGSVGETAVIVYSTTDGRFRAQTKIVAATATSTQFQVPKKASLVGGGTAEHKRASVRLDTLVVGAWRYAPGGTGSGEFARASIRDISRGGCSLICDRAVRIGTKVEVQMPLRAGEKPLELVGEVMRHQPIETSGKHSHGLRFHGLHPDEDQAIVEFINCKQAELRNRGLA